MCALATISLIASDVKLPFGTWRRSIVSSATSSDADSASAYFSSSDFFELIIRIVL
jgi:hypothetical protein